MIPSQAAWVLKLNDDLIDGPGTPESARWRVKWGARKGCSCLRATTFSENASSYLPFEIIWRWSMTPSTRSRARRLFSKLRSGRKTDGEFGIEVRSAASEAVSASGVL